MTTSIASSHKNAEIKIVSSISSSMICSTGIPTRRALGEHDSERRFVLVEFVLGNIRVMDQILNTKLFDHLSLRHS